MAGSGAPGTRLDESCGRRDDGSPVVVTVVAASWHDTIMGGLLDGALRAVADAGAVARVVRVPGTFELPVAAQAACATSDAVVALGVVVRGGTPHFDYVCQAAVQGLTRVALDERTPVGFGVLTCDTQEQGLDRAGLPGSREDKGYEAASAALTMVGVVAGTQA